MCGEKKNRGANFKGAEMNHFQQSLCESAEEMGGGWQVFLGGEGGDKR